MNLYEKVPEAVIRRMPKYYRYLSEKMLMGEERISSSHMSEELGLNASQIRQDLNCFGEFGQQGYGYNIKRLRDEIAHILGLDGTYRVAIVGGCASFPFSSVALPFTLWTNAKGKTAK